MLSINNISKNYGKMGILKNITLELTNGVYGLLAPNGAGKTTLIKLLATILIPSEGEILYNGRNILKMNESYRSILGYLPQDVGYYKHHSVRKYLLYISALKGIDQQKAKEKIEEVLHRVALEDVAHKKMKHLSGGMIKRVGIAQALLNDPKILLLDEPTVGLDPKERIRFRNVIAHLSRNRIIIFSTHNVSDLEAIANEVIMLKDGEIFVRDTIDNICQMFDKRIFETQLEYNQLEEYRKKYVFLSEKQKSEKMKIRFVCEDNPDSCWTRINPCLEDIFLYSFRD